jgi:hypothetical protein
MRSYLFIAIVVLLSSLVLAQEVNISVSLTAKDSKSANNYLLGPYHNQDYSFSFGNTAKFVTKVEVELYPACRQDNCGEFKLCLYLDNSLEPINCQLLNSLGRRGNVLTFDIPTTRAEKGSLEYTGKPKNVHLNVGGLNTGWGRQLPYLKITRITSTTGTGNSQTRKLHELRGDGPVILWNSVGAALSLLNVENEEVIVGTNDTRALVWFGLGEPVTRRTTTQYEQKIMGCLDSDKSGACDYDDRTICQGNDWLNGICCGLEPTNPANENLQCNYYGEAQGVTLNAFCGEHQGKWEWAALERIGEIKSIDGCGIRVVSNGTKFLTCGTIPANHTDKISKLQGVIEIDGHEYFCKNDNVVECGGNTPKSQSSYRTGESESIAGTTHYCTSNGTWQVSLDGYEEACKEADFKWTGKKCCGEPGDPNKTYEDEYNQTAISGGCINNEFVASGQTIETNILNHRGKFYACNPDNQTIASLDDITPVSKSACGEPLIGSTLAGTLHNRICTPEGTWQETASNETHLVKETIWLEDSQGCCPEDQCWTGKGCKEIGQTEKYQGRGFLCK